MLCLYPADCNRHKFISRRVWLLPIIKRNLCVYLHCQHLIGFNRCVDTYFCLRCGCCLSYFLLPLSWVNFFTWALILSFAVPSYIYAYSLTAFFGYFGNLYSFLTYLFGPSDYHTLIPKVDGLLGSILSMSFSLFIYVYLITRASFIYQSQNLVDAGKIMGFSNYQTFKKIIFPSARPGIVVGLSLVAMESISDFGTVSFLIFKP